MNTMSFLPLLMVLCSCIDSINAFVPPPYVNLGSCLPYAVVAGATVTNGGPSIVNGDLALSPGSAVVGFPPGQVTGTQHITDGFAAACMGDLSNAITDANGRPADVNLSGELGGMTLPPGVYKSDGTFAITGILSLDGQNNPDAAWIFIMATSLVVNSNSQVVMLNYDNTHGTKVWWSCGDRADIFTTASIQGTIMAYQSIAAQNGATTGPLMANIGEVTLLSNTVNSYNTFNAAIPSSQPSTQPSKQPSAQPSGQPSRQPSTQPSAHPTRSPTPRPTAHPSAAPTPTPSKSPSVVPTVGPSVLATPSPSKSPTIIPTASPSVLATPQPSRSPTVHPTAKPSVQPSVRPSARPTVRQSLRASVVPTAQPSSVPADAAALSAGAIVGIAVGGAMITSAVVAGIYFFGTAAVAGAYAAPAVAAVAL